jgi:hypothetical protein
MLASYITKRHNPEDHNMNLKHHENFKSLTFERSTDILGSIVTGTHTELI